MSTSSDTTPTGKYLNHLLLPSFIVHTALFPEDNLSVLAAVATTTAPLTLLNTMATRNNMSTDFYSSIDHPHPFYSPSPEPRPTSPRYAPSPIPFCESPLPMSEKSSLPEPIAMSQGVQTDYVMITPTNPYSFPQPATLAKLVKEHYPNPEQFLNVFHSTLKSLYSPPPHHHK